MQRIASAIVTLYTLAIVISPATPVIAAADGTLLVAALATGGGSASDEYLILEADGGSVDLSRFEVAYRSASGLTTRRLVDLSILSTTMLENGERVLLANGAGSFALFARATWSDGIATTGGAILVRDRLNGSQVVDALSWGSAVATAGGEGRPAAAPTASTSLERMRLATALVDTDDNAADFILVPLAANPLATTPPVPTASPPTASPTPVDAPSVPPPPPASTPAPLVDPSPSPTTAPPPAVAISCAAARSAAVGATLLVEAVVLAPPGQLAEPRLAALVDTDGVAGMFLLVANDEMQLQRGERLRVTATLTLRRQALTLVASTHVERLGLASTPVDPVVASPAAGAWGWEAWEARHLRLSGHSAGAATTLADGALSLRLRLLSGETLLLAVAAPIASQLPATLYAAGRSVVVTGVLHQRGGTAGGGYRLWLDSVAGIVPKSNGSGAEGAGGISGGTLWGGAPPPRPAALPLGIPSISLPRVLVRGWIRAVTRVLSTSIDGLALTGRTPLRLVTLPPLQVAGSTPSQPHANTTGGPVRGSCSATHGAALTVRGGLPILNGGDGSRGLSEPPGSTRSACRRPMKAPRGGGVARSAL